MKQRSVRKVKSQTHFVYRIYYGDDIVYVGRTNQPLASRLRGHFFALPMHKVIDIDLVTKIEFASFPTVADMYLYEIYFINLFHPSLNRDDRARDDLTVTLPDVKWSEFVPPLMDKWKAQLKEREEQRRKRKSQRYIGGMF